MAHRKWKEAKQLPGTAGLAWLLLNFFPFPVGHPPHPHCRGSILSFKYVSLRIENIDSIQKYHDLRQQERCTRAVFMSVFGRPCKKEWRETTKYDR